MNRKDFEISKRSGTSCAICASKFYFRANYEAPYCHERGVVCLDCWPKYRGVRHQDAGAITANQINEAKERLFSQVSTDVVGRAIQQERRQVFTPALKEAAKEAIEKLGYKISYIDQTQLEFQYNGNRIIYYPYKTWFTGKGVKDGWGLENLLRQIAPRPEEDKSGRQ